MTGVDNEEWLLECRRFLKVVCRRCWRPPGRRTVDAADRGRLTSEATGSEASVKIKNPKVTDLQTPSLGPAPPSRRQDLDEVEKKDEVATLSAEECNKLSTPTLYTFHEGAASRPALTTTHGIIAVSGSCSEDSSQGIRISVKSTDRNPVEFDEDISELARLLTERRERMGWGRH